MIEVKQKCWGKNNQLETKCTESQDLTNTERERTKRHRQQSTLSIIRYKTDTTRQDLDFNESERERDINKPSSTLLHEARYLYIDCCKT